MANTKEPFKNIGPGQIIVRNMESLNWNNKDLAEVLGMSEKSVSLLINNRQSITVDTAVLLGKAFGSTPEFWMNLEQNYRLRNKKDGKREKETEIRAEVRKYLPLSEMKKKGWVDCSRTADSQVKAVSEFWNTPVLDLSPYQRNNLPFCARQGKTDESFTKFYSITWFQKASTEAAKLKVPKYSEAKLADIAHRLNALSLGENAIDAFIGELQGAGVKFFVLSHLSKTYLDGASFYDGKNPVIVYTARYNRIDNFWWTVAHEISHVLLHMKDGTGCFLDNLDDRSNISKQEKEADAFAGKLLGIQDLLVKAEPFRHYLSEARLLELARSCSMHPSVVLGMLQYHGLTDYRSLPRHRTPVLTKNYRTGGAFPRTHDPFSITSGILTAKDSYPRTIPS